MPPWALSSIMLQNKTILITGSSRGIGAAIAMLAKKYGASVILHGRTNSKELKELAKKLDVPYIYCDVADEKSVRQKIKKLKKIDILVNNAGINPSKTFMELTSRDWKEIFETNVFGIVNVSKAVIPQMIKRGGGKIINVASIKGYAHVSGKPAYAASKAAVMRITTSMAEEFARENILVNAVAPGFTDTSMTRATLSPVIQRRKALPEEIAEAVLFLASGKADYITGQIIAVDGGYSIAG